MTLNLSSDPCQLLCGVMHGRHCLKQRHIMSFRNSNHTHICFRHYTHRDTNNIIHTQTRFLPESLPFPSIFPLPHTNKQTHTHTHTLIIIPSLAESWPDTPLEPLCSETPSLRLQKHFLSFSKSEPRKLVNIKQHVIPSESQTTCGCFRPTTARAQVHRPLQGRH